MSQPAQRPRRRPPVSRQRYLMRRLLVVTILGAVSAAVVVTAVRLVDSRGGEASGEPPATLATPASSLTPSTTAAPTTVPPPSVPTVDAPAEVLVIGDSGAGTFAPYLKRLLDDLDLVETEVDYKVSTGLARPDSFNWPEYLRDTLEARDPDIIVISFGGNDTQGLHEPCQDGGTDCGVTNALVGIAKDSNREEWTAEYVRRVGEVLDVMLDGSDRTVIWVGIPNAEDPERTYRLEVQDLAVRQALEDYPNVIFVDTWDRFDAPGGGIARLVVDPRDGRAKPVRQHDGFHLNQDGAEILAIEIADEVDAVLERLGA